MSAWPWHRATGEVGELHAWTLDEPASRMVWLCEVASPTLVLGSTQSADEVDAGHARAEGIDVVRRRSGGGAVLLVPGECTWLDLVVPTGDPLWVADVGRSFDWLGQAWAGALGDLGVTGAEAATTSTCLTGLARTICFAGTAAGEVTVGGRKAVGLSQRRSRAGARFQCVVHSAWHADRYAALLAPGLERFGGAEAAARVDVATVRVGADRLIESLLRRLP